MDDDYLATHSVYQWVIGQTIDFHLTWPTHERYEVDEGDGVVTLTAPDGARREFRTGELDRDQAFTEARAFILAHADVRGLQRGKHSTWRGAERCKR